MGAYDFAEICIAALNAYTAVLQGRMHFAFCVLHVNKRVTQVHVYFDCVFTCLQANAFRSLRFLFSLERNRRLFKMLFTPQLFGQFIDVGHYHTELKPYYALVDMQHTDEKYMRPCKTAVYAFRAAINISAKSYAHIQYSDRAGLPQLLTCKLRCSLASRVNCGNRNCATM